MIALFLLVCPYIYAYGTGNSVTSQALAAVVFWPLSVTMLVRHTLPQDLQSYVLSLIAVVVMPITLWLVSSSMQQPYRQNSALYLQAEPVEVGKAQAMLLVDVTSANYLKELRTAVGDSEHPAVLDFTGTHPGTVFAIGAKAIAIPWMIGGYAGSTAFADRAIADVPCDVLARAWLLTSPKGAGAISDTVLVRHGMEVRGQQIGTFSGPRQGNRATQHLVSPPADKGAAVAACATRR